MLLSRWIFGLGAAAIVVAVGGLGVMRFVLQADERIDGPVWVDRLVDWSGLTPLGLAYQLEIGVTFASALGIALLAIALFSVLWRRVAQTTRVSQ
jgi:hypothetical protein